MFYADIKIKIGGTTMKRLLAIILAVLMCMALMPAAFAADIVDSGECGENVTWTLDSTGTMTVSGTGEMTRYFPLSNPWADYNEEIVSVVIGDGVTSVCDFAFRNCVNVKNITLGNSVEKIGFNAFGGSVKEVVIPASVKSIDIGAFAGCSPETAVFKGDVPEYFAYSVFDGKDFCDTVLYIPKGNTTWTSSEYYNAENQTWNNYKVIFYDAEPDTPDDGGKTGFAAMFENILNTIKSFFAKIFAWLPFFR